MAQFLRNCWCKRTLYKQTVWVRRQVIAYTSQNKSKYVIIQVHISNSSTLNTYDINIHIFGTVNSVYPQPVESNTLNSKPQTVTGQGIPTQ